MNSQNYKRQAAEHALKLVEPGMVLGLGTGSTAAEFVKLLAERVKQEQLELALRGDLRANAGLG